jgi:hypothetical protein
MIFQRQAPSDQRKAFSVLKKFTTFNDEKNSFTLTNH